MSTPTAPPKSKSLATSGQLATFRLDGDLYGVEVEHVQEVLRSQNLTRVPLAPPAVAGLINLRGQVVTAIELRERLGQPPRPQGTDAVVIVVRLHGEAVSLLVTQLTSLERWNQTRLPEERARPPMRACVVRSRAS